MLEGFGEKVVNDIRDEQTRMRNEYSTLEQRGYRGHRKRRHKERLVRDLKRFILSRAEDLEVLDAQQCLVHGLPCPRCPERMRDNQLWIEDVSPSCVHWSSQGTRLGWLGPENIPLILWSLSLRRRRPDLVQFECTPDTDLHFVEEMAGHNVRFFTTILSPFDVGLPCAGRRLWASGAATNGKLKLKSDPFADETLQSCVYRSIAGTPSMWLIASSSEVASYMATLNESRDKIPPHPQGKQYRPEDLIGASSAGRLHFHRLGAAKVRNQQPEFLATQFFFDISQNVTWARKPNGMLPRQLCNSCVWVEEVERPMLPTELLAAQGLSFYR